MAALREIQDGDSVAVYVELPEIEPEECPLFTLKGEEFIFGFVQENTINMTCYAAYILRKDARFIYKPFRFSYQVEIINGPNSKCLYKNKYASIKNTEVRCRFLRIPYLNVLDKEIPHNYTGGNMFKFSFTIFLPSKPVLELKPKLEDKSVQTVSYSNVDASKESLTKDLFKLMDSGLNHDVHFKCSDYFVQAHSTVLCARSTVFNAMLQGDFREGRTGVIEIQDMDDRSFIDFIKYVYTDLLPELTPEKAMTLYETGDKYDIKSLSMRCSDYLQDNLSPENVCRCLALADAHCDETLKTKAIAYVLCEKVYRMKKHWSPFCEKFPKLALEVYQLMHS